MSLTFDPAHGNFRPDPGGTLLTVTTYAIADFGWDDAPTTPRAPPGTFSNSVPNDRDGNTRAPTGPPGAYAVTTTTSTTWSTTQVQTTTTNTQQQTTSSISTSYTSSSPASLSTTSTMPTTSTVPTSLSTYSESTSAAAPPGPGIPGFPVEAIVLGLIVGLFMLSLRRSRKKS